MPFSFHNEGEVDTEQVEFEKRESTVQAITRLERQSGLDLSALLEQAFDGSPDPTLSLTNLERWLHSTTSPRIHLEHLLEQPEFARLLMTLLGASQPLADSLIQNPELASVILDDTELSREVSREEIESNGRKLVAAATSPSHALDRLRFLKQRWMLSITVNDLSGTWEQEKVWRALSDLAEAVISLAVEVVWVKYSARHGIAEPCPLAVIAFGKLGGSELNYSSDIDLVYVVSDDEADFLEKHSARFCEELGRALMDRMGRGMLFRVDLRLRPYGKSGSIANSMRAMEAYYRLYAEPWEIQALLRSRVILGSEAIASRWTALIEVHCFKPSLGEFALSQMLESRARTEEIAEADDLKRGRGGIRDVEFLTQILQMLHGHESPEVRVKPTCDALRALALSGALSEGEAADLIDGYTLLRQVEHRCQLVGDNQTHVLPKDETARLRLAKSMRLQDWPALGSLIDAHRRKIETLYTTTLASGAPSLDARAEALHRLGAMGHSAVLWFDSLPDSGAFYQSLQQNEGSFIRIAKILREAPLLLPLLQNSLALTEAVFSGEIEEESSVDRRIRDLPIECSLTHLAKVYGGAWTTLVIRWVLAGNFDLGQQLSDLMDALLVHCARRLYADFDIIALGSYGRHELGIDSDADLLLLVADAKMHETAELQAQDLLALISNLRRHGAPVEIDLRLRPEGKQGLLVRTYDGFLAYELEGMEMWERFALGHARGVVGSAEAVELVNKVAYAQPVTPERLKELLAMKHRIETERVAPKYIQRDVKLGNGGLSDIEWFVHLLEMRYPTATKAGTIVPMPDRIRALCRAALINAVEAEELLQARTHLLDLRLRLALLGIEGSVLPENPDRLDLLATELGDADGNAFLRRHERVVDTVRAIFNDGMERLKA